MIPPRLCTAAESTLRRSPSTTHLHTSQLSHTSHPMDTNHRATPADLAANTPKVSTHLLPPNRLTSRREFNLLQWQQIFLSKANNYALTANHKLNFRFVDNEPHLDLNRLKTHTLMHNQKTPNHDPDSRCQQPGCSRSEAGRSASRRDRQTTAATTTTGGRLSSNIKRLSCQLDQLLKRLRFGRARFSLKLPCADRDSCKL